MCQDAVQLGRDFLYCSGPEHTCCTLCFPATYTHVSLALFSQLQLQLYGACTTSVTASTQVNLALQLGARQASGNHVVRHAALKYGKVAACDSVKGLACLTQIQNMLPELQAEHEHELVQLQRVPVHGQPPALVACFGPGANLHGLPAAEGLCVSRGTLSLCELNN